MRYQPYNTLPGRYQKIRFVFQSLKDEILYNRSLSRTNRVGATCGGPMLMIQNQVICFDEVKDKNLFAAKNGIKLYNVPPIDANGNNVAASTVLGTVNKGQNVGMLYSFVERPNGYWLMVYPFIGASAWFVKADNNSFSLSALQQQGAQTETDIQEQNQGWFDSIVNNIQDSVSDTVKPTQTLIKWGIPLVIGYIVYDTFLSSRSRLLRKL